MRSKKKNRKQKESITPEAELQIKQVSDVVMQSLHDVTTVATETDKRNKQVNSLKLPKFIKRFILMVIDPKFPAISRSIGGFISSMTVAYTFVFFMYMMFIGIYSLKIGVAGSLVISIVSLGCWITTWNFINADSVITTILKLDTENDETIEAVHIRSQQLKAYTVEVEREIFSTAGMALRSIAGFISTIAICIGSIVFLHALHSNLMINKVYPTEAQMFLVEIGPVITSWSFVKANRTLSLVMRSEGIVDYIKNKFSKK